MILNPLIVAYAALGVIVILIGWIIRLEIKLGRLLRGKDAQSLEDSIIAAHSNLDELNKFRHDSIGYFNTVEKRLNRSIQAVETIRFNPFKGTGEGGSQSFSTSFLSQNGDGVVISSLYSRDRVSVFSKPLTHFDSPFELTEEEKEVIDTSKKNLQ